MDDMIVFIGSDHVIQSPCIDPVSRELILYTDKAAATACCPFTAGVLNAYSLNPTKLEEEGVSQLGESEIRIISPDAARALSFLGACFVTCGSFSVAGRKEH